MITVESIVRVLHGIRRGHLGRVVAVNFAAEKVPLSLMRYRVRFDDGEAEWYESAMIEEWVVRTRSSIFPQKFATRSGREHGDESRTPPETPELPCSGKKEAKALTSVLCMKEKSSRISNRLT